MLSSAKQRAVTQDCEAHSPLSHCVAQAGVTKSLLAISLIRREQALSGFSLLFSAAREVTRHALSLIRRASVARFCSPHFPYQLFSRECETGRNSESLHVSFLSFHAQSRSYFRKASVPWSFIRKDAIDWTRFARELTHQKKWRIALTRPK